MSLNSVQSRYSWNVQKLPQRTALGSEQSLSSSVFQDKTDNIDSAMSFQGISEKPIVTVSDEVTFKNDGTISAQRLTSTYQFGHLRTNASGKMTIPITEGDFVEQKKQYIEKSLSNSKNIKDCVFMMKNENGGMTQVSMAPDKNAPHKIVVSTKNSPREDFKEVDSFTFDSSLTDTDSLMSASVFAYIDMNGFENLYQFAVGKVS